MLFEELVQDAQCLVATSHHGRVIALLERRFRFLDPCVDGFLIVFCERLIVLSDSIHHAAEFLSHLLVLQECGIMPIRASSGVNA